MYPAAVTTPIFVFRLIRTIKQGISMMTIVHVTLLPAAGQSLRIILEITSFSGSRLFPSSYKVTSPSKVARSKGPARARPIICAVLRIKRMSLNDGGTKRREEMKR